MSKSATVQSCLRIRGQRFPPSKSYMRPLTTSSRPPPRSPSREPSTPSPPQTTPIKFPTSALSYHWDTLPPTSHQLSHASKFFSKKPPAFLWSAEKFKTIDYGNSPEVCFLGRSNVGKSSLLNALLCKKIAHTSSKPGRTKLMNAFGVGGGPEEEGNQNRLVVLDMPGYGKGGRAEWGREIMKYLEKRKELKRAFLLIDAEHGIKSSDRQLLATFKEYAVPFQVVLSKADRVIFPGSRSRYPSQAALEGRLSGLRRLMEDVKEAVQPDTEDDGAGVGEVLACSSEKWIDGKRMGIDAVRFAMLRAAGLEYVPKVTLGKTVEVVPHEEVFGPGYNE